MPLLVPITSKLGLSSYYIIPIIVWFINSSD
jgi:hypothetical protein